MNSDGTPLFCAAANGMLGVIRLLVKAGASVNARCTIYDLEAPGRSRLGTPLDAAIQYNYFMNCIFPILLRAGSDLPATCAKVPYVQRVIDAGSFKKYERAHLARLTSTFAPKFPHLPPELVRNVVSFWLHAGEY